MFVVADAGMLSAPTNTPSDLIPISRFSFLAPAFTGVAVGMVVIHVTVVSDLFTAEFINMDTTIVANSDTATINTVHASCSYLMTPRSRVLVR